MIGKNRRSGLPMTRRACFPRLRPQTNGGFMSKVRVLVGTRKGAFILTSDGKRDKWEVSGPHFAGWEIYHLKGSPVNPDRIYASQTSGWFGQVMQRSDDGGKTWETVGNKFTYDGVPGHPPVVRRHPASVGVQARLAPRAVARPMRRRCMPASKMRRSSSPPTAARTGRSLSGLRKHDTGPALAAGRRRHVPAHHRARSARTRSGCISPSRPPGPFAATTRGRPGSRSTRGWCRT